MPAKPAASQLRYDITALKPEERALDAFPELRACPAFAAHGEGENDKFLRFVVLYCDPGSVYRDLPLDDKKRACLLAAGVPDGPRRAALMRWEDDPTVAMAGEYVRLTNWLEYGLVFHGIESAWQTIQGLSEPVRKGEMDEAKYQTAQKTRKDNLDAMLEQVPKLIQRRNELFMDDEALGAAALLQVQQNTPTAEKRAEGRSFIPTTAK